MRGAMLCNTRKDSFFMGIVIILALGALIGWAGSILLRRESRSDVLATIVCGALGAVTLGVLAGDVDLLSQIEPGQLGWGFVGGLIGAVLGYVGREYERSGSARHSRS